MGEFAGFPSGGVDFHYAELGAAFGGLIVRDRDGKPRPGIASARADLVTKGSGWTLNVAPFVGFRADDRKVLIGGTDEPLAIDLSGAPAANSRIDVLYSLPANVEAGDPIQAIDLVTGLAGPVPSKPAIPSGALELATFRSSAGQASVAAGTLTNTFARVALAGGVIAFRDLAERNAFDAVPTQLCTVGAEEQIYMRVGAAWVEVFKPQPKIYTVAVPQRSIAAGARVAIAVPWPTDMFSATPIVQATAWGGTGKFGASVSGVSKDGGCTVTLTNYDVSAKDIGAQVTAILR